MCASTCANCSDAWREAERTPHGCPAVSFGSRVSQSTLPHTPRGDPSALTRYRLPFNLGAGYLGLDAALEQMTNWKVYAHKPLRIRSLFHPAKLSSLALERTLYNLATNQVLFRGPVAATQARFARSNAMAWTKLKCFFGRQGEQDPQIPNISWVEAGDNPWGIRVLDVRPVTLAMLSTSADGRCAANAMSFGQDDGTGFIGEEPPVRRTTEASLRFPIDRVLADGVLFVPREMEHKWALFYHRGQMICVRSWTRKVHVVARCEQHADHIEITQICGTFGGEDEEPVITVRMLDYLLRSHALDTVYPAPLPLGMEKDPKAAAMWCMSMFGNRALFATPYQVARHDPARPLRPHSLLHIAVAQGNAPAIEERLAAGIPIDGLAGDGLAPLHWALACDEPAIMTLLLDKGSSVDVRSSEGATPLMNAVQSASVERVSFLLDHGADVNAQDLRGFTALHRAAEMGHLDVLRVLLDRGAAPRPEAEGHTPRSLAERRGHREIIGVLDRHIGGR